MQVRCFGVHMGIVTVLKDQTLKQLTDEAVKRWPGAWDSNVQRVQVLVLCKRSERIILEQHGATVEHEYPVFGLFHRPRHSLHLFESQGFNPREASFQFLDIATHELGNWLQHLVTNDGWKRSSTRIAPLPIDANVPMQRRFEIHSMLTFRHPDLPELKNLHIPMPFESMVGKAYVSFPLGSEADIEDPVPRVESIQAAVSEVPIVPRPNTEEPSEEISDKASITDLHDLIEEVEDDDDSEVVALIDGFSAELLASVTHSATADEVPDIEIQEVMPEPEPEPVTDEIPMIDEIPEPEIVEPEMEEAVEAPVPEDAPVPTPEPVPIPEPEAASGDAPMPKNEAPRTMPVPSDGGVVDAFRQVVQELLAEGMEAGDMMGDPRFAEASEFCEAAGVDTWPLFMRLTSTS